MLDTALESLTKAELVADLESAYVEAKPANDKMVDIALRIQSLNAEALRRAIEAWLPGIKIRQTRLVTGISCSANLNAVLPKLKTRLDGFARAGLKIVAVEFETNLNEFRFYTDLDAKPKDISDE